VRERISEIVKTLIIYALFIIFLVSCPAKVPPQIQEKSTVIKGSIEMPYAFNPLWEESDTIFVINVYNMYGQLISNVNSKNAQEYIVPEYHEDCLFITATCYQNPNIELISFVQKQEDSNDLIVNLNVETTAIAAIYAKALIEKKSISQIPISLFLQDSALKEKISDLSKEMKEHLLSPDILKYNLLALPAIKETIAIIYNQILQEINVRPDLLKEPAKSLTTFPPFDSPNNIIDTGEESLIPSAVKEILVVTPSMITIKSGDTVQFTVTKQNIYGNIIPVTPVWEITEGKGKGTIDANGKFKGTKTGTVVVRADYEDITTSVTIVIIPNSLKKIIVSPEKPEITLKQTQKFTAIGRDDYTNDIKISPAWSLGTKIGKIDENGLFTPSTTGTTKIYATFNGIDGYADITVHE